MVVKGPPVREVVRETIHGKPIYRVHYPNSKLKEYETEKKTTMRGKQVMFFFGKVTYKDKRTGQTVSRRGIITWRKLER